jgi:hypothetical protein
VGTPLVYVFDVVGGAHRRNHLGQVSSVAGGPEPRDSHQCFSRISSLRPDAVTELTFEVSFYSMNRFGKSFTSATEPQEPG